MAGRTNAARPREREVRGLAMAAARETLAANTSFVGGAQNAGVDAGLVKCAALVLRYGSPEEIATADSGDVSLVQLAKSVRSRLPPEARPRRRQGAYGSEVKEARKLDIQLWERLNTAFDLIAALPRPEDVIRSVRKHHRRVVEVERKLATAYTWIEEFSDAWTK